MRSLLAFCCLKPCINFNWKSTRIVKLIKTISWRWLACKLKLKGRIELEKKYSLLHTWTSNHTKLHFLRKWWLQQGRNRGSFLFLSWLASIILTKLLTCTPAAWRLRLVSFSDTKTLFSDPDQKLLSQPNPTTILCLSQALLVFPVIIRLYYII